MKREEPIKVSGRPFEERLPPFSFYPLERPFDSYALREMIEYSDPIFREHVHSVLHAINRSENSEHGPVIEAKAFHWKDVPDEVKQEITQGGHGAWPVIILLRQPSGDWWYPSNKRISSVDMWSEYVSDGIVALLADLHDALHVTMRRESLDTLFNIASEPESVVRVDWWAQEDDLLWMRAEVRLEGGFDWWLCRGPWKAEQKRFRTPAEIVDAVIEENKVTLRGAAEDLTLHRIG